MNNQTTRVIKNHDMYYPQYLQTWWFGKYKRWTSFTYTMSYLVCSGFAENVEEKHKFKTRLEAIHFIRRATR